MGKRQLLFVTYRDENLEEGISYAIELAKAMYEDITLLLVQKKSNLMDRIENFMTAVSFAEEGQHEEARRIASGESVAPGQQEKLLAALQARCSREGVVVSVQETDLDVVPGIRTFLKNHAHDVWACDFVPVIDLLFRTVYVFFVVELGSRRVVHVGATRHPTDAWTAQQLREATPYGQAPRLLIRDRGSKYGDALTGVAKGGLFNPKDSVSRSKSQCDL